MQNFQIGLDIIEINRFKKLQTSKGFLEKVFTEKERRACLRKLNLIESLAARYAAKEALKKTIKYNVGYNCIEVLNMKDGQPIIRLLDPVIQERYQFQISLSHTKEYAAAVCLTISL